MARSSIKTSRPVACVLLGVAATLAVLAGHIAGLDERTELQALDLRFRHFSSLRPAADILHVDIDDSSLAELGRWPWPRKLLADIVDVLVDCGARAVALDVIMPEPQEVRYVRGADEVYSGADAPVVGGSRPVPVFDDAALAEAIARGPNVFLPMHLDFAERRASPLELLLEEALFSAPALTADQLAAHLARPEEQIEPLLRRAKQRAIEARAGEILSRTPRADFEDVLAEVLPGLAPHRVTDERQMLEKAYLRDRAVQALERFSIPAGDVADLALPTGRIVPPLVSLAQATQLSGFVTVEPDADGVVRRVPLLARAGGRVYRHFALALAGQELARDSGGDCHVAADASCVRIRCPDGACREIPVDRRGRMLVHWACEAGPGGNDPAGPNGLQTQERACEALGHIPAAAVAAVCREEAKLGRLDDLAHGLRVAFLNMGSALPNEQLEQTYWEFVNCTKQLDQVYLERVEAEREAQRTLLYRPTKAPDARRLAALRKSEQDVEARLRAAAEGLVGELRKPGNLEVFLGGPAASQPQADAQARAARTLGLLDSLPAERRSIQANLAKLLAELRPLVAGKLCIVGSTSTGAADLVPTPLAKRAPCVTVVSNAINTILTGRFVRPAGAAASAGAILAAGILVSLLAATSSVTRSAPLAALLAAVYAGVNGLVVFALWDVWLVVVAPLAAMGASFMAVTAYRQLTEERAKRRVRDMFAHALSPALVDRLLEDPSLAELGGQKRTISCMFSDVAGFTALSERLGPQGTVRLLNRYFDRATEIVQQRWGGYLNKFLGDGTMVLFGAPVHQDDHAARAIRSAVDCQAQVAQLDTGGPPARLAVRIGITTGEAMVGNCGSSQRMDYTAIGDCVNLASRLESACKFFGAGILVCERTWRSGGSEELLSRPLGEIFVVGRREPVRIWEVLGRADGATMELRQAMAEFADAMALITQADFAAAAERLERISNILPGDRPTQVYLDSCRRCIARPPDAQHAPQPADGDGTVRISWPSRPGR